MTDTIYGIINSIIELLLLEKEMLMKKPISVILVISLFLIISNCATSLRKQEPTQLSNLTIGMVRSKIIKGETAQAEILKLFGSPHIKTKNRDNDEVWNYNRMSCKTTSSAEGVSIIFFSGRRTMITAITQSFDLILIFDENDVVKDYSVISAKF